jgi:SAM-dependent methyltransferase
MEFDDYAADYEAALARGVGVSGEDSRYFARGRIAWLAGCLDGLGVRVRSVLDFGCGTGASAPLLLELLGAETVIGVDQSSSLLEVARRAHASARTSFLPRDRYRPSGEVDLAYSNGVLHHVPPAERASAVGYVRRALGPGGLFAVWENNPWNPGARYVMSRIPFDRDAVPLKPAESRRLLDAGGFDVVRTDFLFVFPRALKRLRPLERMLARWPLGAQYQVLCRKR